MALISVIVPIYNVAIGGYLEKCLDSLVGQTYQDIEIILVNDGSTDNSLEICQRYAELDSRVKIIDKLNGGVNEARRYGFKESCGTYISNVDGDDYLELNAYELLAADLELKNYPDLLMFKYCREWEDRVSDVPVEQYGQESFSSPMKLLEEMIVQNRSHMQWMYIYDRKYFSQIVGCDALTMGEDMLFTIQLVSKVSSVAQCDHTLYHYIQRSSSACFTYNNDVRQVAIFNYLPEIFYCIFKDANVSLKRIIDVRCFDLYVTQILSNYVPSLKRLNTTVVNLITKYPELKERYLYRRFGSIFKYYAIHPLLGHIKLWYYRKKGKISDRQYSYEYYNEDMLSQILKQIK